MSPETLTDDERTLRLVGRVTDQLASIGRILDMIDKRLRRLEDIERERAVKSDYLDPGK